MSSGMDVTRTVTVTSETVHKDANPYLTGLTNGGERWDTSLTTHTHNTIGYFVDTGGATVNHVTAAEVRSALDTWAHVANINVVPTTQAAAAEIVVHTTTKAALGKFDGYSGTPGEATESTDVSLGGGQLHVADLGRVHTYLADTNGTNGVFTAGASPGLPGQLSAGGQQLLIHELGHALGLAHPHDDGSAGHSTLFPGVDGKLPDGTKIAIENDIGDNGLNQGIYTVMSYNPSGSVSRPWGAPESFDGSKANGLLATPMALDIAAIQRLYGANTTYAGGDTPYSLPAPGNGTSWSTIWDTGGVDEIRYSGFANAVIDLRAATLDNSSTGGGMASYTWSVDASGTKIGRGFMIAGDINEVLKNNQAGVRGVQIENATGGSGADQITGNAANNVLSGNGGADLISGGDGNDTIIGGGGDDIVDGGRGNDMFEIIRQGFDIVTGGDDNDTMAFSAADAGVNVDLKTGLAWFRDGAVTVGNVAFNGIENLWGSNHIDVLTGDGKANVLHGRAGMDTLEGGGGNDTLTGGRDADTFVYRSGWGQDTITDFAVGSDLLDMRGVAGLTSFGQLTQSLGSQGLTLTFGSDSITLNGVTSLSAASVQLSGPPAGQTFDGTASWGGTVTGTAGVDTLSFAKATSAVFVDLAREGGYAESLASKLTEHFTSIENVTGATNAMNYLYGDAGANVLTGGNLNDYLSGRGGSNTLVGGGGTDYADYYESSGPVSIDLAAGRAVHATGTDTLSGIEQFRGTAFGDTFSGDSLDNYFLGMGGIDTIRGNGGADWLEGVDGNDIIDGGAGTDKLVGGLGDDRLTGGLNADRFVFRDADTGRDRITDFHFSEGDRIDFSEHAGVNQLSHLTISNDGAGSTLLTYASGSIVLEGVAPSLVQASWFTF